MAAQSNLGGMGSRELHQPHPAGRAPPVYIPGSTRAGATPGGGARLGGGCPSVTNNWLQKSGGLDMDTFPSSGKP